MTTGLPLLDASFVRELEALKHRMEIRARSGGAGEHIAKRRGGSAEFQEHRPYTAGDDVRRIDWAAMARSGQPVVKVFRAEEDLVARLLCDASASLDFGQPSKLDAAKRLAAAMGYLALADSERAQVITARDGGARLHPPARGRGGLASLLRTLDAIVPKGRTDLAATVERILRETSRPGLLLVISDFFDPGPVLGSLSRAVAAGHDIVLAQVLAREEMEPEHEGDWAFEDAETGQLVELTVDAATIEAYAARLINLCEQLQAWARRHGACYVRHRSDESIEPVIRAIVSRSRP
jgi:uncharacterized protein (DUF58 family)